MGWFSKIFKKEEPQLETAYVDIEELQQWFESKSEPVLEDIHSSMKEDLDKINEFITNIRSASKGLGEAKLRNDKIPERAMQIMEGNRKAYINAVLTYPKRWMSAPAKLPSMTPRSRKPSPHAETSTRSWSV